MIADSDGGPAPPDKPEDVLRQAQDMGRRIFADTVAMTYMASLGFQFTSTSPDRRFVYCQRWLEKWVDLASLTVDDMCPKPSGCLRYERRGFPWPKDERPEALAVALGTIPEVARQVSEWPE